MHSLEKALTAIYNKAAAQLKSSALTTEQERAMVELEYLCSHLITVASLSADTLEDELYAGESPRISDGMAKCLLFMKLQELYHDLTLDPKGNL